MIISIKERMKRIALIAGFIFFILGNVFLNEIYPEENPDGIVKKEPAGIEEDIKKDKQSKNFNIDMLILYGMYNNVFSTANLSYNDKDYVYLLTSDLRRSNDFGYKGDSYPNSSFYENKIGFTGDINVSETWKMIMDVEADNDSRGMFDNDIYSMMGKEQVYNREEKDKVKGNLKSIFKVFSRSLEWYMNIGGAQYAHRLIRVNSEDPVKTRVAQGNIELGGEFIWSASNRVRFKTGYFYNDYSDKHVKDDWHSDSEIIDDFKILKNFVISLGMNLDLNKDETSFQYIEGIPDFLNLFIVGFSVKGLKYFSTEMIYKCDIVPFHPEEFYLEQKFIRPTYDLPPGKVHHGHAKLDFRANSLINLKGKIEVEKNDNFYNYFTVEGNTLSAETIEVTSYNTGLDTKLNFYKKLIELTFGYMYSYYDAAKNITYHPNHNFSKILKFNATKWGLEWGNRLIGNVYTDPDEDDKLSEAIIGHLGVQLMVLDGFYSYLKIDNLYNNKYNLREGFPEPGISFLGGLRILI